MAIDSSKLIPVMGALMDPFITNTPMVYDIGEDIVVASVTSSRLRSKGEYIDAHDPAILPHITDEDRTLGKEIRFYFSTKLTMQALSGKELRSFRNDLLVYLTSGETTATTENFPMIYRLPEFYTEDMIFEKVSKRCSNGWRKDYEKVLSSKQERMELEFLDSHTRLTSQSRNKVFWFRKTDNKRLVKISIDLRNPLLNLFIDYVNKHAIIALVGKAVCLSLDGQDYYKLDYWNLEI